MNLSPRWCGILQAEGWESVHWSQVGAASAPDHELIQWALNEQRGADS
jgi:predicted nuclease of predicted toxin-antitoxin system